LLEIHPLSCPPPFTQRKEYSIHSFVCGFRVADIVTAAFPVCAGGNRNPGAAPAPCLAAATIPARLFLIPSASAVITLASWGST
jgi:hypothetical protein